MFFKVKNTEIKSATKTKGIAYFKPIFGVGIDFNLIEVVCSVSCFSLLLLKDFLICAGPTLSEILPNKSFTLFLLTTLSSSPKSTISFSLKDVSTINFNKAHDSCGSKPCSGIAILKSLLGGYFSANFFVEKITTSSSLTTPDAAEKLPSDIVFIGLISPCLTKKHDPSPN